MGNTDGSGGAEGTASDDVQQLSEVDELLNELVTDCHALSQALRHNWSRQPDPDDAFWLDTLESLHALNDEVRLRLSKLDTFFRSKGTGL